MNNSLYKKFRLEGVYIPRHILVDTEKHLQYHGRRGNEGLVYWSGHNYKNEATIKRCLYPVQHNTSVTVDVYRDELARINLLLEERDEVLIAQVHSHPGMAFHSGRDDDLPITFYIGFMSFVVPNFCAGGIKGINDFELWEHVGFGKWRYIDSEDKLSRLRII
jgi:hypothetical protein